ncbi:MAG: tetratricopeptide repeat protein, partial [Myxococcota bacterium]
MAEPKPQEAQEEQQKAQTPGQLLAARKAAKAAKKAARRGRQAEARESEAIRATTVAADWARDNRRLIVGAVVAVVLTLAAVITWVTWDASRNREASELLWEGTAAATAPLEDGSAEADDADETFTSISARAQAAIERFDRVIEQYPRADAATWARLGKANALLQMGEAEPARAILEELLQDVDRTVLRWRTLEALAQSYELDEAWTEAAGQYAAIRDLGDRRIALDADYQIARITLAQGKREAAQEALEDLRGALREEDAPELPTLSSQVDELLGYLDPSAAPPSSAGAGIDPSQLDPEQLQELMRRMQEQQGGGGAPPGAGGPAGGAGAPPGAGGLPGGAGEDLRVQQILQR